MLNNNASSYTPVPFIRSDNITLLLACGSLRDKRVGAERFGVEEFGSKFGVTWRVRRVLILYVYHARPTASRYAWRAE